MGRTAKGPRVLGPYRQPDGRWRVVVCPGDGSRESVTFAGQGEAVAYADEARAVVGEGEVVTWATARERYERHLVDKGNKPGSRADTARRLRRFFASVDTDPVQALTVRKAGALYRALVDEGLAADTHRNYLAEAKTFARWCVKQGWLAQSPLDGIEGVGVRRHGKPQLRVDELRKLAAHCHRLAASPGWRGDGATAILIALYLGLRASEITGLARRDVDDGGRLLWVAGTKSRAARRLVEVPEPLRPHLVARARGGEGLLLPAEDVEGQPPASQRHWRDWVTEALRREARAAGVPQVPAHGLRGAVATLAADAGIVGHLVASHLGHESYATTATSYAEPATVERATRRRGLRVLAGGK